MRDDQLIEPFVAPEYFVDGFAEHWVRGGNFFFCAYRLAPPSQENGLPLKVVVARFVCPVDAIPDGLLRAKAALSASASAAVDLVKALHSAH